MPCSFEKILSLRSSLTMLVLRQVQKSCSKNINRILPLNCKQHGIIIEVISASIKNGQTSVQAFAQVRVSPSWLSSSAPIHKHGRSKPGTGNRVQRFCLTDGRLALGQPPIIHIHTRLYRWFSFLNLNAGIFLSNWLRYSLKQFS